MKTRMETVSAAGTCSCFSESSPFRTADGAWHGLAYFVLCNRIMKRATGHATFSLPFAALLVLLPASAWGHNPGTPQGPGQPVSTGKPEKASAPPLFPKHRRGIYRNLKNDEVVDATPQSPPLDVDDPSVPDNGEWEINIGADANFGTQQRLANFLLIDANYGILPNIIGQELPMQVKVEFPVSGLKEGGAPFDVGVGGAALGLKVNFFQDEHSGVSLALYPQVELSASRSVEKGLAEPGQTLVLPLLVLKETKVATLVFNAGIEQPIHDAERKIESILGVGIGRALTRKFAAMADIRAESPFDFNNDRIVDLNIGVIYGVRNVPVYAKVGHSLHSDDGGHTYVAFGGKVILPMRH
jgi:hypothetical protein